MTLATSCDSYSGAGLVALKLYILKKCVTCCVIVLSCDISSMSLFQTVYYYLNISHPLIDFLISLIHLGVLGFWGIGKSICKDLDWLLLGVGGWLGGRRGTFLLLYFFLVLGRRAHGRRTL